MSNIASRQVNGLAFIIPALVFTLIVSASALAGAF
jgi:hypothetical protein